MFNYIPSAVKVRVSAQCISSTSPRFSHTLKHTQHTQTYDIKISSYKKVTTAILKSSITCHHTQLSPSLRFIFFVFPNNEQAHHLRG